MAYPERTPFRPFLPCALPNPSPCVTRTQASVFLLSSSCISLTQIFTASSIGHRSHVNLSSSCFRETSLSFCSSIVFTNIRCGHVIRRHFLQSDRQALAQFVSLLFIPVLRNNPVLGLRVRHWCYLYFC
jgi:hypothetical protein